MVKAKAAALKSFKDKQETKRIILQCMKRLTRERQLTVFCILITEAKGIYSCLLTMVEVHLVAKSSIPVLFKVLKLTLHGFLPIICHWQIWQNQNKPQSAFKMGFTTSKSLYNFVTKNTCKITIITA